MWAPEAQGKVDALGAGARRLARPRAAPVRRRRRLGHLRLLHRRRSSARKARAAATSRRARTTTCSCRASRATSWRSASSPSPTTTENKAALKLVAVDDGKADNGAGPILPSVETVQGRHLSAAVAARSSSTSRRKALERPEVRAASSSSTSRRAARWPRKSATSRSASAATSWCTAHFEARKTGSVFEHAGSQVGLTIEQLLAARDASRAPAMSTRRGRARHRECCCSSAPCSRCGTTVGIIVVLAWRRSRSCAKCRCSSS